MGSHSRDQALGQHPYIPSLQIWVKSERCVKGVEEECYGTEAEGQSHHHFAWGCWPGHLYAM